MTDETDRRAAETTARTLARVGARHGGFAAATDALLSRAAGARMSLDTSPRDFERLKAQALPRKPEGGR